MPSWNEGDRVLPKRLKLPASRFPERASSYVCDGCGAEVTKYLYLRPAKARPPYGPEKYVCRCGRQYPTGAVEWDSLNLQEKHRRILWLFLGFVIGLPAGFVCYLFLTAGAGIQLGLILTVLAAGAYPAWDGINIFRSIIRTRSQSQAQTGGGNVR
jgi:hypothetical protein